MPEPVPDGVDLAVAAETPAEQYDPGLVTKSAPAQIVLAVLGVVAFLYFARPVVLPVVLACIAGMTLKPVVRWLSGCHIPAPLSAAIVLCFLVATIGIGFFQLGRPALRWMNDAPEHLTALRQKCQKLFPGFSRFGETADAVNNLGATAAEKKAEQKKDPTVEAKGSPSTGSILNWTGSLMIGLSETLALIYLLLASGDLFLQKLVHLMPTLSHKKRAVEINREIQQNISNYLFSVSLINVGLGAVAGGGLYCIGVPNAAMWGMFVAALNFVPYFGPIAAFFLLTVVGLLTFDTLWQGLLPPAWYLVIHLLEANLITPILLGRRFTLNPVVIFVSLIFWTWLWGVPGAFLSVPILVSIKAVSDRVPALSSVSELLAQ